MSGSRPKPSAICLLILEILLCISIYLLCVYIRRRRRDRLWFHTRTTVTAAAVIPSNSTTRGLDPTVVASFPIIPYNTLVNNNTIGSELDCAVCLSSFQDHETLRFIPACQHVFHPECVDPWLALHTTCPYCRSNLAGSGEYSTRPVVSSSSSSAGEVVILVTVTNEVSGVPRAEKAESGRGDDNGRYTLRLSDEAWKNIVPESSSRHGAADDQSNGLNK